MYMSNKDLKYKNKDLKYKNKYLKYKNKYLYLQSQIGGVHTPSDGDGIPQYGAEFTFTGLPKDLQKQILNDLTRDQIFNKSSYDDVKEKTFLSLKKNYN